jgi:hypothetical protein
MLAVDTSTVIDWFHNKRSADTDAFANALRAKSVALPPVVVAELLSDPKASNKVSDILEGALVLELKEGYWERAGIARSIVLQNGLKARLGDALVAQACIDHDIPLIARDGDFRHFVKHCGLKLAL